MPVTQLSFCLRPVSEADAEGLGTTISVKEIVPVSRLTGSSPNLYQCMAWLFIWKARTHSSSLIRNITKIKLHFKAHKPETRN
jgi:hypothetical protein